MAFKSIRVSDLTGAEGEDSAFITVVVREHPGLDEPVQIDALPEELKSLKGIKDLVVLELKQGESTHQLVTTREEFNKLSPNMQEVLDNADGLRGRRRGFRPQLQPKD